GCRSSTGSDTTAPEWNPSSRGIAGPSTRRTGRWPGRASSVLPPGLGRRAGPPGWAAGLSRRAGPPGWVAGLAGDGQLEAGEEPGRVDGAGGLAGAHGAGVPVERLGVRVRLDLQRRHPEPGRDPDGPPQQQTADTVPDRGRVDEQPGEL